MMGVQEASARLFYDFDLEAHVAANHILREVDRFLDVVRSARNSHRITAISADRRLIRI